MKPTIAAITLIAVSSLTGVRADLVALYTFDNSADPREDSSLNSNTLTDPANGAEVAAWGAATGYEGSGGFTFDGNDRLIAPIDVNPGSMPQMTWGAWVRTDSLNPGLRKVMGHDNGGWDRTIGLDNRTGPFRYSSFNGFQRPVVGTLPGPANTTDWTFLSASYDAAASNVTVYVDLDASTSDDALVVASETGNFNAGWPTFAIGGLRPDNGAEGWAGAIDNAFVFNEILDEAALSEIRRRGVPALLGIPEGDPAIDTPLTLFGDLNALGAGPGTVTTTLTITNQGLTQELELGTLEITGPDSALYDLTQPAITTLAADGGTAEVDIMFTPPVEGGSFEASLEIPSNDLETPTQVVSLNATVTSDPNIEVVFADPLFGAVSSDQLPASVVRTVTVRNTGVANSLTLSPPAVSGADFASYAVVGDLVIPPGEERLLEVTLTPGGRDGVFQASLEVASNDADTPTIPISLDANLLPLKLLAFYCFDNEGDPFQDLSGNDNHITEALPVGSEPTWGASAGFEGSGAYEYAAGSRLIVPIDVNPTALPQMSWGAWVRTDDLNPGLRKVMGHDNGGWDRTIGLDNREGSFRYSSFTGFRRPVVGTPGPENTTDWTFLAASYDQEAQTVTAYVDVDASSTNDSLVAVTEQGNFNAGWPTFSIGSLRPDNQAEGWTGAIDNVFVYQGILSAAQMEELRNKGKVAITGGATGPRLDVSQSGDDLVFTWESAGGKLYNLRSEVDPSAAEPVDWPLFDGRTDMVATPPMNSLTIPRPADTTRFFVIEEFDAPPVAVFSDDFESGQGDWTMGSDLDPGTDWELGIPSAVGPSGANSGSNCFGTNIASNYEIDSEIWLRSPVVDLTGAGGATLNYFQFRDIEAGFDKGRVRVLDASDDSQIAILEDDIDDVSSGWEAVSKSLPAAALGKNIKIEFRFFSDDLQNFAGWYVDDVEVTVP